MLLKRLAKKHFKKWKGILVFTMVYNPLSKDKKNIITQGLHPDLMKDKELKILLKQVANKVRDFYDENPKLLKEVGIENK